jgi:serine phosphatase RsbU (regulator of sigma subunit)
LTSMFRVLRSGSGRVVLVVYGGMLMLTAYFIIYSYQSRVGYSREAELHKQESVANLLALRLSSNENVALLNEIVQNNQHAPQELNAAVEAIRSVLGEAQEVAELSNPINVVFISSDGLIKRVVGNDEDLPLDDPWVNEENVPRGSYYDLDNSAIVTQSNSQISVFSPIKIEDENSQIWVQLSANLFPSYQIAKQALIRNVAFAFLFFVLIGLLIFRVVGSLLRQDQVNRCKLKLKNKLIREKSEDITASIRYAKKLQAAFRPDEVALKEVFSDFFLINLPKDIIGGDFVWCYHEAHVPTKIVVHADCTGHGVPGAMMGVLGNTLLNEIVSDFGILNPADILTLMNRKLINLLQQEGSTMSDGMDISVCAIDLTTGILTYAGANQALAIIRAGELIRLRGERYPIGGAQFEVMRDFQNTDVELLEGDQVYLYSDGYADQFGGEHGKRMSRRNFFDLLLQNSIHNLEEQKQALINRFSEWKGAREQVDDVSLVGFKFG